MLYRGSRLWTELLVVPFSSVTGAQYRSKESIAPSWWILHGIMLGVYCGAEVSFDCVSAFVQGRMAYMSGICVTRRLEMEMEGLMLAR
jgi:hypothetical protein